MGGWVAWGNVSVFRGDRNGEKGLGAGTWTWERAHSMTVYPAIDIRGGRCVRLTQGRADAETVYAEDPASVASGFKAAGSLWVHVVDLDGAFGGEPRNLGAVERIAGLGLKVQLGGGLRTRESVERAFAA